MKYIAIDYNSAKEIISNRTLQTSEFENGKLLVEFIKNGNFFEIKDALKGVYLKNGNFIISPKKDDKRIIVFDISKFSGFKRIDSDVITILQKSLRLSIRLWDKIGFAPCEKIITGTNYIALLPLSFSTGKSYKVMLDKSPDSKRQEKRDTQHFLVFYDGFEQTSTEPSMSVFRQAEDEYRTIVNSEYFETNDPDSIFNNNYIEVSSINGLESSISPYMGFDFWKNNLTATQKDFVFSERLGPDILKGAAGTGKTLCLVLRCINQLIKHNELSKSLKTVFFTHSIATKKAIELLFNSNNGSIFLNVDSPQNVLITTLQEWCIDNLGVKISSTEYLDKDALESKNTQLLYINESYEDFILNELDSSKKFISSDFLNFIENGDSWTNSLYIQNEISTYIKGRAGEDYDVYKSLPRSKNSIPLIIDHDFSTMFYIYNLYQKKLTALNLFDSDDITISALQETSTPIWRRRKINDGYDVLYIDETHLFNINELSLFHNLLKKDNNNIVFTIDRSQASGDSSISSSDVLQLIDQTDEENTSINFNTVFRCSDQIINLASCVLASGATLFSHLDNPLIGVSAGFTSEEERFCMTPYIKLATGFDDMLAKTIIEVNNIARDLQISVSNILIVPCDDFTQEKIKSYFSINQLKHTSIESRGDFLAVKSALKNDSYISGTMDYIGGLEFPAVVITGIDSNKFPGNSEINGESSHFVKYSAFNKLYVAITRAKYVVAFISDKTKGVSETIQNALDQKLIINK